MELRKVTKTYKKNNENIMVLNNVDFKFEMGKFYMVIGTSGAGKTTLINLIGLLDKPNKGDVIFNDCSVSNLNDNSLADIRLKEIGLIFQDYYLNPRLNAYDNILLALLAKPP